MRKNYIFVTIFFTVFAASLLAVETGNIAGKVTIGETNEPLEGASVYISSEIGTYTKENGSFILKNVPIGIHKLHANFIGFEKQMQEVEVESDLTSKINFYLEIQAIKMEGISITGNRAVTRETPIAFTNLDEEIISEE